MLVLARSGLDPETMPSYTVTLHSAILPGLVSPQGQEAVVRVEVPDRNDNPPVWQQEQGDRGGLVPPSVQLVSVSPGWRLAPAWQSGWPRTGTAGSWAG